MERAVENVEVARRSAHAFSLAFCLAFGAIVYQMRGDRTSAANWSAEAIALAEAHGFPVPLGVAKVVFGWTLAGTDSGVEAMDQVKQGLSELAGSGTRVGVPFMLCSMAETQLQLGQPDDALATVDGALSLSSQTNQRFWDASLLSLRGEVFLELGGDGADEAEDCLRRSIDVAREQGARSPELRASTILARLWTSQGRVGEARAALAPIYGGFTEGFDTVPLQDAKALLEELA